MNTNNFSEWTKEEKDEFAKKRMNEMRLKNAQLERRHAEVQDDKIAAENRNSAITNAAKIQKQEKVPKADDTSKEKQMETSRAWDAGKFNSKGGDSMRKEKFTEHTREWDIGKPSKNEWDSQEGFYNSHRSGSSLFGFGPSHRKDKWGNRSKNECERHDSWQDYGSPGTSGFGGKSSYREDKLGNCSKNESEHHDSRLDYGSSGVRRFDGKSSHRKENWGNSSKNECEIVYDSRQDYGSSGQELKNSRKDIWSSRAAETDNCNYDRAFNNIKSGRYKPRVRENDQQSSSFFQNSPKRTRSMGNDVSDSYRKSVPSQISDRRKKDFNQRQFKNKKPFSNREHHRSSSQSNPDQRNPQTQTLNLADIVDPASLWRSEQFAEDQNKQQRVKTWVVAVNKTNKLLEQLNAQQQQNDCQQVTSEHVTKDNMKEISADSRENRWQIPDTREDYNLQLPEENMWVMSSEPKQNDKKTKKYSKFERYEKKSSSEGSDEDYIIGGNKSWSHNAEQNKTRDNVAVIPESCDYNEYRKTYGANSDSEKINNEAAKKCNQIKRAPQCSSAKKNEYFRKQRRYDLGESEKRDWNSSVCENKGAKNYSSKDRNMNLGNCDSWNKIQPQKNTPEDDGIWGNTQQSNVKWTLSDEDDCKEVYSSFQLEHKTEAAQRATCAGGDWHDYQCASNVNEISQEMVEKCKIFEVKNPSNSDDGGWATLSEEEEGEIVSDDEKYRGKHRK